MRIQLGPSLVDGLCKWLDSDMQGSFRIDGNIQLCPMLRLKVEDV